MKTKAEIGNIFRQFAEQLSREAHDHEIFDELDPGAALECMEKQVPTLCRHHVVALSLLAAHLHAIGEEGAEWPAEHSRTIQ